LSPRPSSMATSLDGVTVFLIVRHGQSTWNAEHRWQGLADPPLSELGREQARALAADLRDVSLDAVYASDLQRARDTAEAVAHVKGLAVVTDPALREIDVGEWSGLTADEIKARFPAGWERLTEGGEGWERGETHAAMSERIMSAVSRIAAAHPGEQILCVLHGGVIRALLARAAGMSLTEYRLTQRGPANGTVSRIAVEDGTFRRID
jgi:probable phosphoglycerate mutase